MAGPPAVSELPPIRSFHHADYDVARILAAKDLTVSVCLPARDEAATIGPIVETIRKQVVETGLADELIVLDDHSTDDTARAAASAGATVVAAEEVLPHVGGGPGKGAALWRSLAASKGDVVVWCDADIEDFGPRFVTGVLGPLLCEPDVELVKGHYRRPTVGGNGGGRVTELVARPLLSMLFPELEALHQPLSGEYGGRRSVLEQLPFVDDYGVDVGLLIDYVRLRGTAGLAQVDLDVRWHRNRSLDELAHQARAVMHAILHRADPDLVGPGTDLPPLAEVAASRC